MTEVLWKYQAFAQSEIGTHFVKCSVSEIGAHFVDCSVSEIGAHFVDCSVSEIGAHFVSEPSGAFAIFFERPAWHGMACTHLFGNVAAWDRFPR